MIQRKIARIQTHHSAQGFLGSGHLAAAVVDGSNFEQTDPFFLLMDDRLDLPGGHPVGGPHPHAGFETATLVLEGSEASWQTGAFELMTAGSGIVHTEEITTETKLRILQLWLILPPEKRWTEPFFQEIKPERVPTHMTDNSEVRVYSGSSNGLTSPVINQTPVTIVDFKLGTGTERSQQIPASYNGFIYVIEGTVSIGTEQVEKDQSAWLEKTRRTGTSEIIFKAGKQGARFILYAGEPQHAPIVSHGPFIGNSKEDIRRLYHEYNRGRMKHVNDLPESHVRRYV
ncbi:hypothetical protein SAMN05660226_03033 [Parapedobacter luteus]|uniref:Pirin family protein n=1 Tax=Parapedobacter luteus TaxID=623280 RepID=A0A1T5E024_9SPHI|nr:pirin-like C-terminal cupin domain-containing protein [Parapedobacter luteus]SKB77110.1 hypothetical protein SAMN05660226_03033 [Parapedobacter luteus]